MDMYSARGVLREHVRWLRLNGQNTVADAFDLLFKAYFQDQDDVQKPTLPAWEIGKDYASATGNRRRLVAFDRTGNPVFLVLRNAGDVYDDDQCVVYLTTSGGEHADPDECIVSEWVEPKQPEKMLTLMLKRKERPEYQLWHGEDYDSRHWEIAGSAWVVEGEFAEPENQIWEPI